MKKHLALFAAAAACAAACTSKSAATGVDASATDAASDAGGCAQSRDAFCATLSPNAWPGVTCADIAAEAQGIAALCGAMLGPVSLVTSCSGYDVLSIGEKDTGNLYYYDPTTRQLVAAATFAPTGTRCLAGPPGFAPPTCGSGSYPCPATDGGNDAAPTEGGSTDAPAEAPPDAPRDSAPG